LDDYYIDDDDYISNTPDSDPDAAGAFAHHELPVHALHTMGGTVKIEDEDDNLKERRKFKNAKRAAHRQHIPEQHHHQPGNFYNFSTTDPRNFINVDRDATTSSSPGNKNTSRWKPTAPQTITSLKIT
jgi:hypothetical protein